MNIRSNKKPIMLLIIAIISLVLVHSLVALERRKEQFVDQMGYLIVPVPYSIPGIGEGWVFFGSVNNAIFDYGDLYGYKFVGDADGHGFGVSEIHLIPELLYIDYSQEKINKASKMFFHKRGMDSEKEDFRFYEVDLVNSEEFEVSLVFFNRLLEFSVQTSSSEHRVTKIRDDEGKVITEVKNPEKEKSEEIQYKIEIDWTDDNLDPRQGINAKVYRNSSPRDSEDDPDYYVMSYNLKAYIPIGAINTLVFNYYQSNAHVTSKGLSDETEIKNKLGYNCSAITDPTEKAACETAETEATAQNLAYNQYGNAQSLGGRHRLRSYPEDRFVGANSLFYGVEFRWNMTEEYTPFNVFIMDDVRTGVQLAIFHETGGVADKKEDVTKDMRTSTGVGMRVVTGSGIIYRIDYATGDEGAETTMIVDYPW